jgi:histidyl-tRNA synthetase
MVRFRLIEEAFRDCCLKWGYEEVRTPTLEYLHLFTATGTLTPSLLGKVYSFLDWDGWSGERVVLRPDGTIPIARLYIDSRKKKALAKLFYVANVFIFEETGKETREKWQCGVELMGASSPLADAELIMLALEALKKLGLEDIELRLSHAGLIRALLQELEPSPEKRTKILDQVLDGNIGVLTRLKTPRAELDEALPLLLDLKGKSSGFIKNLRALLTRSLPELEPSLNNFVDIVELLEALGCQYQIDLTSGRGFEYYTGMMFQLSAGKEKIGGGGRYDALIPLMGYKDIPASGFALYLDRLMDLIKPDALAKPPAPKILVRTVSDEPGVIKECFHTASRLREAGYTAELNLGKPELSSFQWTLNVQDKTPQFVLTNLLTHEKFEAKTSEEVLAQLSY